MENVALIRQKAKQAYFLLSEILQLLPVEYGNLHLVDDIEALKKSPMKRR